MYKPKYEQPEHRPKRRLKHSARVKPYPYDDERKIKSEEIESEEIESEEIASEEIESEASNVSMPKPALATKKLAASKRRFFPSTFLAPAAETAAVPVTADIANTTTTAPVVPTLSDHLARVEPETEKAFANMQEPQPVIFSPRSMHDSLTGLKEDRALIKYIKFASLNVSSEKEPVENKRITSHGKVSKT